MAHALVLPLPAAFSPPDGDVEGYSVFTYDESTVDVQHPQLEAYINQLGAFLRKTRLIQFHPGDFFRVFLLYDERKEFSCPQEPVKHLDGSTVREEEVKYMQGLCEAFAALVTDNSTMMGEIHTIVRDGPPADAADCLHSFYKETKELQMNRRRSPKNDAASATLRTKEETQKTFPSTSPPQERESDCNIVAKRQRRRERVMEAVLGYGMGKKKRHEVSVMCDTVADLVHCCNAARNDADAPPSEPVKTVLNIGEGKGYVSRALALCDGLQVVGLDCNPLHKEKAVEWVEFLLQGRLSVDTARGESAGRDVINLMYEPRGHMATITCRVGPNMKWADVLRGHVSLSDGTTCCDSCATPVDTVASSSEQLQQQEQQYEEEDGGEKKGGVANDIIKVQCRICGYIVRRGSISSVLRHVRHHLEGRYDDTRATGLPSKAVVDEWNCKLPTEAFNEKIILTFFAEEVVYAADAAAGKGMTSFTKRSCPEAEGGTSSFGKQPRNEPHDDAMKAYNFLACVPLTRGTRAEVILPVRKETQRQQQVQINGNSEIKVLDNNNNNNSAGGDVFSYVKTCFTVVGYDYAPNRHFVIRDDGRQKEAFTVVRHRSDPHWAEKNSIEELRLPPAKDAWDMKLAFLQRVIPPVRPRMPVVDVPDLRNAAMIGLHPCGDLGSNVCRLFAESASPGLLLVSCCWHALTNAGFPLSLALQQRGWKTEHISLLLATQPLDMWSTMSADGYRGSARVLFYRSLLGVVWSYLRDRWKNSGVAQCCPFFEVPHLEPAFLRRIAKVKDIITMEMLYVEVCREYFGEIAATELTKSTLHSCHKHACSSCREAQRKFLFSEESVTLTAEIGPRYFDAYFPSFLGLTVLRMWMCHLVETLLLLDRTLFLSESLRKDSRCRGSVVSLVPLFDGAVSPRMYGILARRIPH